MRRSAKVLLGRNGCRQYASMPASEAFIAIGPDGVGRQGDDRHRRGLAHPPPLAFVLADLARWLQSHPSSGIWQSIRIRSYFSSMAARPPSAVADHLAFIAPPWSGNRRRRSGSPRCLQPPESGTSCWRTDGSFGGGRFRRLHRTIAKTAASVCRSSPPNGLHHQRAKAGNAQFIAGQFIIRMAEQNARIVVSLKTPDTSGSAVEKQQSIHLTEAIPLY